MSQFLRELHFIEAPSQPTAVIPATSRRSSFGNCTSLRPGEPGEGECPYLSQFLRELHFIEAGPSTDPARDYSPSQFLLELHFIEAQA